MENRKSKSFGALLKDLSKESDCLDHELITAKHDAYGISLPALQLTYECLSNKKQRTKIDDKYSSQSDLLFSVQQGSILGPLLFNFFMEDLSLFVKDIDINNYAEDSTLL